jgi:hypothetical protein
MPSSIRSDTDSLASSTLHPLPLDTLELAELLSELSIIISTYFVTPIESIEAKLQEEMVQNVFLKFIQSSSSKTLVIHENGDDLCFNEHLEWKEKSGMTIILVKRNSNVMLTRLCGHVHVFALPCDLELRDAHVIIQSFLIPFVHALTNSDQRNKTDALRIQASLGELERLLPAMMSDAVIPELGIHFDDHVMKAVEKDEEEMRVDGRLVDKLQADMMIWIRNIKRIKHRALKTPALHSLSNEIALWTTLDMRMKELQDVLRSAELGIACMSI